MNWFLYILFLIIFVFNLNGIFYVFADSSAFLSPLILIISFLVILRNSQSDSFSKASLILRGWFLFYLSYIVVGLISLAIFGFYRDINFTVIRTIFSTIILLYALTMLILELIKTKGLDKVISITTVFLTISAVSIIFIDYFDLIILFKKGMDEDNRNPGLFLNPNEAGYEAVTAYIFILFSFKNIKKFYQKSAIIILLMFVAYAAFLTFSKAAILSVFIVTFVYLFLYAKKNFLLISSISLVMITVFYQNAEKIKSNFEGVELRRIETIESLLKRDIKGDVTTGRSEINEYSWQLISDNPLIGIGLGNFGSLPGLEMASHNTYFQIWGEAGILVLLIFLVTLLNITVKFIFGSFDISYRFLGISLLLLFLSNALVSNNLLENRVFNISFVLLLCVIYKFTAHENPLRHR